MNSACAPDYTVAIRDIQAAVHPQTGEAGVQFVDATSSSVFLPVSAETLERLTADIRWVLMRLDVADAKIANGR